MRRREFITLLGGTAAAWPLAARAQQPERVRRIGVLMTSAADDPEGRPASRRSCRGLQQLGWTDRPQCADRLLAGARAMPSAFANTRRNWSRLRRTSSWPLAARPWRALQQATRTVPIVFMQVADPVGAGFVESLARPGGNATGFTASNTASSGKWLELLKEIAPSVTRVAVLRDPAITAGIGQFGAIQSRGAVVRGGVEPGRRARRRRDRARPSRHSRARRMAA